MQRTSRHTLSPHILGYEWYMPIPFMAVFDFFLCLNVTPRTVVVWSQGQVLRAHHERTPSGLDIS